MMHTIKATLLALLLSFVFASPALAQRIALRGTLTYGSLTFTADDTFESALGDASAPIFTAGGQVLFPNGVFVEVTHRQARRGRGARHRQQRRAAREHRAAADRQPAPD